jgi:gliding motility-associated-like protein
LKLIFYILTIIIAHNSIAQQSLVPNGSFELYDTCPYFPDQINFATGWFQATTGTSDYFNECYNGPFPLNIDVPSNFTGYQFAYDGKGYAGFYPLAGKINGSYNDYCEYIETQLLSALLLDSIYNISFYISVANGSNSGVYNLGVLFTDTLIHVNNYERITVQPSCVFDTLIMDTTNWVKMSFDYKANGNEQFMTIGKFDTIMPQNAFFDTAFVYDYISYVYIDGMSMVKKISHPIDTGKVILVEKIPNVFTPDNDGVNDFINFSNYFTNGVIYIYNRWGVLVFKGSSDTNLIWNGANCTDGVYFYVINSQTVNKQGTIHLLRSIPS